VVVVYDRAETSGPGYAKRWWLQLAAPATVRGQQAVSTTPGGQQLFVTALLPTGAAPQAVNQTEQFVEDTVAHHEPMQVRLMTEAPGAPASVRMLHVMEAADGGAPANAVALVRSDDGLWEGALVADTVVLFAQSAEQALSGALRYTAPDGAAVHVITGLAPNAGYDVQLARAGGGTVVSIQPGLALQADEGGVLVIR
ncbi:MAG TPA: hypothetical protein VL334_07090, partial [Anaerolineae bacterium]|nr:hypothetical protein [Anaerolineae bacterium]